MDLRPWNVLSLFSGGGGLDRGVKLAAPSARVVGYVEREAFACAALVSQMEKGGLDPAPVWTDVATFDGRPWRGVVDLVAGGFPCQDISNAGKRAGLAGARSGLWRHFARIVGEVAPSLVFVENVAALVKRGLDQVLADLAALGFDAEWGCFRASDVGAPQGRARLFLLAYARGRTSAGWRGAGNVAGETRALEGQGRQRQRSGDAAADRGEAVADPERTGRRPPAREDKAGNRGVESQGSARIGERGRAALGRSELLGLCDSREALADTDQQGWQGWQGITGNDGAQLAPPQRGGGDELAHADLDRRESEWRGGLLDGERAPRGGDAHGCRCPWPPGPDDDGWRRYLDRWPGTEPAVCRSADGLAYRIDRLRLLGNGVVDEQAALAFRTLYARAFPATR